jgi:hypothetical protein
MNIGENNLAASLVQINKLNMKLQRISADGRRQDEMRELATQIMLECQTIREVTEIALQQTKPGLFERWFGDNKSKGLTK